MSRENRHNFALVPQVQMPRSSFDLSHRIKTTFNSGELIPMFFQEVLPGDTFNVRTSGFTRLSTPLFPYMDDAYLDTFYFFIPNRLVWDNWQRFMGERDSISGFTDYLVPVVDPAASTPVAENDIFQYFGLPVGVDLKDITPTALMFRALIRLWNEWFRDENLQDPLPFPTDDGPDEASLYSVLRRNKAHDYFTSCLPWPQKGNPVPLPVGGTAPIGGYADISNLPIDIYSNSVLNTAELNTGGLNIRVGSAGTSSDPITWQSGPAVGVVTPGTLYANLSLASSINLNDFRYALALQTYLERNARGGTRYIEIVRSQFGVTSDDARLQRTEYLGGGSTRINVHPVAATADNSSFGGLDAGGLRAFATGALHGHGFTKSFTEHGIVIGLCSVRAELTYQQNLNRFWFRRDKFDFYTPALSQIGEQPVYSKEIFCDGSNADDDIFGYQEPFADYRYRPSIVTGQFNSYNAAPLDAWHLALDFGNTRPTLNDVFIEDHPPFQRVVQVTSQPEFIADFLHSFKAARVMPLYGVPASLGRF